MSPEKIVKNTIDSQPQSTYYDVDESNIKELLKYV